MLILSRKNEESIIINGEIELKIISIDDNRVRIGIQAPRNIQIHRKEIYDQIMAENRKATESSKDLKQMKDLLTISKKNPV